MIAYPIIPQKRIELFRSHLLEVGGCLEWIGSTYPFGYGRFNHYVEDIGWGAHRFAFALHNGYIDTALEVCHTCDNPPCCKGEHLFQGTQRINMSDMTEKGRRHMPDNRGELNPNTRLTNADVLEIRRLRSELGLTYDEIAHLFPIVTAGTISRICRRLIWTDI